MKHLNIRNMNKNFESFSIQCYISVRIMVPASTIVSLKIQISNYLATKACTKQRKITREEGFVFSYLKPILTKLKRM